MRRIRAELSVNDSVARFTGLGVDVFQGQARFTGRDRIEVEGQTLRFSRSGDPTIEGLYRTHWVSRKLSEKKRGRLAEKAT